MSLLIASFLPKHGFPEAAFSVSIGIIIAIIVWRDYRTRFIYQAQKLDRDGDTGKALLILLEHARQSTHNVQAYSESLNILMTDGRLVEASNLCDEALEKHPNNIAFLLKRIYISDRTNDYEAGLIAVDRTLARGEQ